MARGIRRRWVRKIDGDNLIELSKEILKMLRENVLFQEMTEEEIAQCLEFSGAIQRKYNKEQTIFERTDTPMALFVLLQGSLVVCKDSLDGKRYIATQIEENDIFGEVFVFLDNVTYTYYGVATSDCVVLELPKEFFNTTCGKACSSHSKLINNLLKVLARKAYFLNNKVQLLTSGTLRQKIARLLLETCNKDLCVKLNMNREQMASYLNVTRPSLSRELINMQDDNLIEVKQDLIKILDYIALEELL